MAIRLNRRHAAPALIFEALMTSFHSVIVSPQPRALLYVDDPACYVWDVLAQLSQHLLPFSKGKYKLRFDSLLLFPALALATIAPGL